MAVLISNPSEPLAVPQGLVQIVHQREAFRIRQVFGSQIGENQAADLGIVAVVNHGFPVAQGAHGQGVAAGKGGLKGIRVACLLFRRTAARKQQGQQEEYPGKKTFFLSFYVISNFHIFKSFHIFGNYHTCVS